MSHRILVIDDDPMLLELLQMQLEREGFSVTTATNGRDGVRHLRGIHPDVILLDIMMPGVDGWNTYQQLRQLSSTPVIVLTAKADPDSKAKGLALGIDDYLDKPYSFQELKERITRLLDRDGAHSDNHRRLVFDDGTLRIDLRYGIVVRNQELLDLSPTELRLLTYLAGRRGRIIPYQELLTEVWGPEYADQERYLHMYVDRLRGKIEPDPARPQYIRIHQGTGYCFAKVLSPAND